MYHPSGQRYMPRRTAAASALAVFVDDKSLIWQVDSNILLPLILSLSGSSVMISSKSRALRRRSAASRSTASRDEFGSSKHTVCSLPWTAAPAH